MTNTTIVLIDDVGCIFVLKTDHIVGHSESPNGTYSIELSTRNSMEVPINAWNTVILDDYYASINIDYKQSLAAAIMSLTDNSSSNPTDVQLTAHVPVEPLMTAAELAEFYKLDSIINISKSRTNKLALHNVNNSSPLS